MRFQSPRCLSAALAAYLLLSTAAQAQVIPFGGNFGPGLSPEDNRLMVESIARLNAAEPSRAFRIMGQPADENLRLLDDTPGVPLTRYGLPPGAPSNRRRWAGAASR